MGKHRRSNRRKEQSELKAVTIALLTLVVFSGCRPWVPVRVNIRRHNPPREIRVDVERSEPVRDRH